MVTQYPHILKFDLVTAGEPYTDENGDTVVPDGTTTTFELKCRFEPNQKGETIPTNDGLQQNYGWMVYFPLPQLDIPEGITIIGYHGEKQIASGTVKRYSTGQLNARVWV